MELDFTYVEAWLVAWGVGFLYAWALLVALEDRVADLAFVGGAWAIGDVDEVGFDAKKVFCFAYLASSMICHSVLVA